jgi:hypothetical protein
MSNPLCKSEEDADDAIDQVWERCYNDTAPFERIPDI